MKNRYKILALACAAVFGTSCQRELEIKTSNEEIVGTTLDVTKYVAIGNSLTAGLSNSNGIGEYAGLYEEGQLNSYPNIVAKRFSSVGGGDFRQPIASGNGSGYAYVESFKNGSPVMKAKPAESSFLTPLTGEFNNLGVSGIRVRDVTVPGYGTKNPFLKRMLDPSKVASTSYLDLVKESKPSFFTCWLGNNDILSYATKGGKYGVGGTDPLTGKYGVTSMAIFAPSYQAVIAGLKESTKQGVLLTIPSIVDIPFFTTVPYDTLDLSEQPDLVIAGINQQIEPLNLGLVQYNMGVVNGFFTKKLLTEDDTTKLKLQIRARNSNWVEDSKLLVPKEQALLGLRRTFISVKKGVNPLLVLDPSLPGPDQLPKVRQLVKGELPLLSAAIFLAKLNAQLAAGTLTDPLKAALPDSLYLSKAQIDTISTRRREFNDFIKTTAEANDLGFIDGEVLLNRISGAGELHDGVRVTSAYISGGVFSLDGVHLTPRGNALIANELFKEINNKYDSKIPRVNVADYRPVILP